MRLAEFLGLRRNIVLLLVAIIVTGAGEETWMRFVPKYLETLGASVALIGLYDLIKTLLGAVYAYPGGVLVDRWGHRNALVFCNAVTVAGYAIVLSAPRPAAVLVGVFLFVAWATLSLPANFSLVAVSLHSTQHTMGIGVQSLIRRLPILVGPVIGGVILDRFGVVEGVRIGVAISIVLGLASILLQWRIQEARVDAPGRDHGFLAIVRAFDPSLQWLLFSDILIRFCERIPFAWVVIYAMNHAGASATQVGLLTSIEMLTAVVCYIPVARLADRHGREPFVIATFVFFTLFPVTLLAAHDFPMLALAFVVRGLKEFGDPARKALIINYCRPETRGREIGAYYLIRDTAVSVGALIGAGLWKVSPVVNFIGAAALGAAGTLAYVLTLKHPPRGSLSTTSRHNSLN